MMPPPGYGIQQSACMTQYDSQNCILDIIEEEQGGYVRDIPVLDSQDMGLVWKRVDAEQQLIITKVADSGWLELKGPGWSTVDGEIDVRGRCDQCENGMTKYPVHVYSCT